MLNRGENNKNKVFVVKTEPEDVCGTMSVWLEGFRCCYAVDGLTKVFCYKEEVVL